MALIYWLLSSSRNVLFKWGLLQQYKSRIPVISVGNLCMGGSGKTPHVALIIEYLTDYNKAVISRGYGRKNKDLIDLNNYMVIIKKPNRRKQTIKFIWGLMTPEERNKFVNDYLLNNMTV